MSHLAWTVIFIMILLTVLIAEGREGQWCQWTVCRFNKCGKQKDAYLTSEQMEKKFVRPGKGWMIRYECWPMRPQQ